MGSNQPNATNSANPAVQQRQGGRRLGSYLDLPAILGSFLMLLLAWAQFTDQVPHPWHGGIAVLFWILWGFYVLEYLAKIVISHNKLAYVRGHWLDLITALFPFVGFLRAFKGISGGLLDSAHLAILKQRQLGKLTLITVQIIFISAVIELVLEQHAQGSNITNWVDALYWSATTVTTVASQYAPVTTGGEIVSFLLMLYAVLVFTYFMSSLASALIGGDQQTGQAGGQGQQTTGDGQRTPRSPGASAATDGRQPPSPSAPAAAADSMPAGRIVHLTDGEIAVLRTILQQVDRAER
jgi:voltage-gated potassium channel